MKDSAIRLYESGRGNPTQVTLQRIAVALNVPVAELLDTDSSPDLLPAEFNEFERFIETLGYYTRMDGNNYRLHKGRVSVVITPDELKALVRASKATVAALVQDLMETATPAPDAPETPPEGE